MNGMTHPRTWVGVLALLAGLGSAGTASEAAVTDTSGSAQDSTAGHTHQPVLRDDALGQVLLLLPFRDASGYKASWDVYGGFPRALADSLERHTFLSTVPLEGAWAGLTEDERRGKITGSRAVELAREQGADWAILGQIEEFTMKRFEATVPMGGYRRYEGWAVVNVVAYNAVDGRRAGECAGEGMVDDKRTGIVNPAYHIPFDRQYYFLDMMEWGSEEFWSTLVGMAVRECVGDLATGLTTVIRPPPSLTVSEPKLIDIDGDQAYINVGLTEGIRNGDKFGVWDHGRELRDPETDVVLGQAPARRVGVVQVEQVLNDHLSQVRILEGREDLRKAYTIRAE